MKNQHNSLITIVQTLLKITCRFRFLCRPFHNNQSEMDSQKLAFSIGSIIVQSLLFVSICILLNACKTGDSSVRSSDSYVDTTSPTITEISPANGSSTIRGGSITVTFSEEMDPSTLTTNTTDNTCSGTIQVSNDDFSTCVQMAGEPTSDVQNVRFSSVPMTGFEYDGTYQIKIDSTVSDISGEALENSFNSSFTISHVKQLSVGGLRTCALLNDGSVYCWGRNPKWGTDDWFRISKKPEKVEGIANAKILSAHIEKCIINDEGEVQCWSGVPGHFLTAPRLISNIANAIDIQSSTTFSCALLAEGTVKCWGNNFFGQLGIGVTAMDKTDTRHETPVKVSGIENVIQIQTGSSHACALHQNGIVYCWGDNFYGQVGAPFTSTGDPDIRPTPVRVANLSNVSKIALGSSYACAVLEDSTVKCWGSNEGGQLGSGIEHVYGSYVPITIEGISGATDVFTGMKHVCALLIDRSVKCWGDNSLSQLGIEDTDSDNDPTKEIELYPVTMPHTSGLTRLVTGVYITCGIYDDYSVKCWGSNDFGQLGEVDITESVLPITINEL